MEKTLKFNVRNSELAVAKDKRVFLTYPANGLMACTLDEAEDSINFVFDTQGMEPSMAILSKPKWEKLRFLVNCVGLSSLDVEYDFSLSLENQLMDINLMPKILTRDAKKSDTEDFQQRYMALAGSILLPKYKYEDYLHGGSDLFRKNKLLSELSKQETLDEVRDRLLKEYRLLMWETSNTKRLVTKQSIWFSRIAIPLLITMLLAVTFLGGRMMFVDIPFRDSVIVANTAYINNDPLSVQQALRAYNVERLPVEARHFLSRSYVSTEALTDIQRENILLGLSPMTNSMLFDYWIHLGRLYFNDAVDIAQRLGDDELLLYAYLKQEVFIRNDLTMPGEERAELLSILERNIEALNRARDEAVSEVFGINP